MKKAVFIIMAALIALAPLGCGADYTARSSSVRPVTVLPEQSIIQPPLETPNASGYYSFDYNGTKRQYMLHVPDELSQGAPLVCVLHGYSGTAEAIMETTNMNSKADRCGFAVVYPQGFSGTGWNSGLSAFGNNDLGFIVALVRYLQQACGFDAKETFATGFSNGGFMVYKLAFGAPETFRAVACVSGTTGGATWKERSLSLFVPLLHIHGTEDTAVPIKGTMSPGEDWGGVPPVSEIIAYWADKGNAHDLEIIEISDNTTAYRYSGKNGDNLVWYYEIEGFGHSWPRDTGAGFNAEDAIWEFFSKYVD